MCDTFAASDVLLIELIIGIQTAHLLFVVLLNVQKEALSNWLTEWMFDRLTVRSFSVFIYEYNNNKSGNCYVVLCLTAQRLCRISLKKQFLTARST